MYEKDALQVLGSLFKKYKVVFLTGGSGLYIDALCEGMGNMPDADMELRKTLGERMASEGVESLRLQLKKLDPKSYFSIDLLNKKRIVRALEVCLQTGKPYSSFITGEKKQRPFEIVYIALNLERSKLHERINSRTDLMIANGLVEEAKNLLPFRNYNALNTVGYKELFGFFDGAYSPEYAVELIKRNTRRYARRQISWFNRDNRYKWFVPEQIDEIKDFILRFVKNNS